MRRPALKWVALVLFGLAAVVFTLLEITVPGLMLLFSSIVLGVFAIATPELLDTQPDESDS